MALGWECEHCGGPVPASRTLRHFCSNACRQAAYRERSRRDAAWLAEQSMDALEAVEDGEELPPAGVVLTPRVNGD